MPRRLAQKLIISLTIIVVIVEGVAGIVNIKTEERQLLLTMILGADQLHQEKRYGMMTARRCRRYR